LGNAQSENRFLSCTVFAKSGPVSGPRNQLGGLQEGEIGEKPGVRSRSDAFYRAPGEGYRASREATPDPKVEIPGFGGNLSGSRGKRRRALNVIQPFLTTTPNRLLLGATGHPADRTLNLTLRVFRFSIRRLFR
jgi:hypothetical protein